MLKARPFTHASHLFEAIWGHPIICSSFPPVLPHWTKTVWNFAFNSGLNSASRKIGISILPKNRFFKTSIFQLRRSFRNAAVPMKNDRTLSFKRDMNVNREADRSSIRYKMKIIRKTNPFQHPACDKMNPMNKITALPINFPVLRTCLEKSLKSLPRKCINKFRFPSMPLKTTNNLAPIH